jgi:endonuclease YncB( thermonuclease family)
MLRYMIAVALVMLASPATSAELRGIAEVVDSDTLHVEGIPVRLDSIDAPEDDQLCQRDGRPWRCGDRSAGALRALAHGRLVVCITDGTDRYRRILARCSVEGVDLAETMVRQGWALDFTRYSKGRHATAQAMAEIEGIGLWSSAFIPPWEWRRAKR